MPRKLKAHSRPAASAPPSPDAIDRARAAMRDWSPSTRTSTGVIGVLADDIDALIARGARPRDVVDVLGRAGIPISIYTLRDHLRRRAAVPPAGSGEVRP